MTNLKNQVAKCIRYAAGLPIRTIRHAIPVALLAFVLLLQAGSALAQPIMLLSDDRPTLDISASSLLWIDAQGTNTVAQVAARSGSGFSPSKAETVYTLGANAVLWQHYRFALQAKSHEHWVLEFPQPLLDRVTVYQSTAPGQWTSQTAGDTVPVANWSAPGRYAQFRLDADESGGVKDVYVQIHNVANISIPVRVTTHGVQTQRLQLEYLMVGFVFGTLVLLIITCLAQSWSYRDLTYSLYAAYATILMLTMAAWMGVAGHLLWNRSPVWNDLAPGCLGVLTGSSALLFINHICGTNPRRKWIEPVLYAVGAAGLPIAFAYTLMDRGQAVTMISSYLITIAILGMAKAASTWRRNDLTGMWVLAAFTPTALATMLLVSNVMGVVPSSWLTRYGLMLGLIVEVPLLLIALNSRSRERHDVEARAQAMPTQDALTGLLTPHLFQDRLRQTVGRTLRYKEPAAVVYIKLVNYSYIKKTWGVAVAEQSLLRSVIKLRRILRDVDTVGRVDEALFGLIMEGASERSAVTALSARLIAAGLMPLKGLKPEVILQFHVAAVLLGERPGGALEIDEALTELIKNMGSRTRRPIRFLEPELTRPMELGAQSEFEPEQTDPGRRIARAIT